MKKVTKILTIVLLIAMIVMSASNVFASQLNDMLSKIDTAANNQVEMGSLPTTVGTVVAYMRNASILIGVVILVVLGIKYMMGSIEQKAEYQKSFVPLIVGIVLIMAATSIASFVFSIFTA